jgi:hypothetical protein
MGLRTKATVAAVGNVTAMVVPAGWAFAQVDGSPDAAGMPGAALVTQIISWLMWGGLMACLGAFVYGAAMWRGGAKVGNYGKAEDGRQYVAGGAIGALLIGLAVTAINTFFAAGQAG